jgi:hypothetical protein
MKIPFLQGIFLAQQLTTETTFGFFVTVLLEAATWLQPYDGGLTSCR